jgi:hypothetical protein
MGGTYEIGLLTSVTMPFPSAAGFKRPQGALS